MYKEMMDSIGMIQSIDPELGSAMNEELHRQRQNIELIASENSRFSRRYGCYGQRADQ